MLVSRILNLHFCIQVHLLNNSIVDFLNFWRRIASCSSLKRKNWITIIRIMNSRSRCIDFIRPSMLRSIQRINIFLVRQIKILVLRSDLPERIVDVSILRRSLKELVDCVELSKNSVFLHVFDKEIFLLAWRKDISSVIRTSWRSYSDLTISLRLLNSMFDKVWRIIFKLLIEHVKLKEVFI